MFHSHSAFSAPAALRSAHRTSSTPRFTQHCQNEKFTALDATFLTRISIKIALGGVGGPAGPLTGFVSTGFAGRAGRFRLCRKLSLHGGTAVRAACSPDSDGVQYLEKVPEALFRYAVRHPVSDTAIRLSFPVGLHKPLRAGDDFLRAQPAGKLQHLDGALQDVWAVG